MPENPPTDFPPQYDPKLVEDKWIAAWLEAKVFTPRSDTPLDGVTNYSIVIPPPNVTGSLHMGHALNSTLQDILARYHRMRGDNVLWVVGTDHAGIATQNVVEKQLGAQGKKRDDLGREGFVKRVWEWKTESGGTIIAQLKRLGASCDFDHERFTMDEGLSRAVRKVFVDLYNTRDASGERLMYRGKRLINWCPRCHTALSDLEVEHVSKKGHLWYIRYLLPVHLGAGASAGDALIVATTRPETLFGDVAVAVHPEDGRYQDLIGKSVILPLTDREIPVIADDSVDHTFGSGAVKITPAHDFSDFAAGARHGLPQVNILTPSATLNQNAGGYAGLDRFKARDKVVKDLEEAGLLASTEDHTLSLGHCYRCKTVVEPYLSDQWFVRTRVLAEKAIAAVKKKVDGTQDTRFVPEHWEKTYFQWLENIQDWCVSRQIWWGHQIPAWYCLDEKGVRSACEPIVAESAPTKCPACDGTRLEQDPDVLDTWFSSALWPFSTLGWPEKTDRLRTFYPTSVLVTAFDIIFFWVARMMMFGCHFMGEVPFKTVYIHALVRDPLGQKMSKSKGNVVDPLIMMHKYGTDAFRFTLAAHAAQGRDIKLDEARIEGYRAFCNKIWNAARFGMMMAQPHRPQEHTPPVPAMPVNRWILFTLGTLSRDTPPRIEAYEFNLAAQNLYTFFWNKFCDWYIELIKPIFKDGEENEKFETAATFFYVLETSLAMLHPFMPFITEEISAIINPAAAWRSLTLAPFPKDPLSTNDKGLIEDALGFETVLALVVTIRSLRQDTGLKANTPVKARLLANATDRLFIASQQGTIATLARVEDILFLQTDPAESCAFGTARLVKVFLPCAENNIDPEAVRVHLMKKRDKSLKLKEIVMAKLANAEFMQNAPEELITEQQQSLIHAQEDIAAFDIALRHIGVNLD